MMLHIALRIVQNPRGACTSKKQSINYLLRCCAGAAFESELRLCATCGGRRVATRARAAQRFFAAGKKNAARAFFAAKAISFFRRLFAFVVKEQNLLTRLKSLTSSGFRAYIHAYFALFFCLWRSSGGNTDDWTLINALVMVCELRIRPLLPLNLNTYR